MPKPITKESALQKLASLCGRSEQCEFEVMRKLLNWGITSGQRKEILEYLIENRYVDNARFARSYASDKARFSSWGPFKIRAELIKRRINAKYISEAVNNIDSKVWKEGILRNATSKSKNLDLTGENGYKNRQKLFRYLLSRGFPSGASTKVVELMKKRQEKTE